LTCALIAVAEPDYHRLKIFAKIRWPHKSDIELPAAEGGNLRRRRHGPQVHSREYSTNSGRNTTTGQDWPAVAKRLGWLTFEDIEEVVPGACPWFQVTSIRVAATSKVNFCF